MDPRVLGEIRLADRRGLLQGRYLSRPQAWAVATMILIEEADKKSARINAAWDAVRQALLTGPTEKFERRVAMSAPTIRRLYPELFPKDESRVTERVMIHEVTEKELIDTKGEWDFTQTTTDEAEIEKVLRSMGQTMNVTLTQADTGKDDEGWM